MRTAYGHLTYCTNIHAGESWEDHFAALKASIPRMKAQLSPFAPFGIGLRLSNTASLQLAKEEPLAVFKNWLLENNCYVFTMNGFPYGNFHRQRVKEQVHEPDWSTPERVQYTLRLFRILAALLPVAEQYFGEKITGGISTSPLSYKLWFKHDEQKAERVTEQCTFHLLQVIMQLVAVRRATGMVLHLDVEPEPDGLIGSTDEFIHWYDQWLLPLGVPVIREKFRMEEADAIKTLRDHVRICYDICHTAVGYENPVTVLEKLSRAQIQTGKLQISAAIRIAMEEDKRAAVESALRPFNEQIYLHQVIARTVEGRLLHYPDLPDALADIGNQQVKEWRSHFHVPVFVKEYGILQSTQPEIEKTLSLLRENPFTDHLEVETYTWEVLPEQLKLPLNECIIREVEWVRSQLSAQS